MLATEYTDFSLINTNGVTVADTFNSWRKSTNGIIQKLTVEAGSPTWDSTGKVSIGGVVQNGSATIVDIGVTRNGSGATIINLGSVALANNVVINRAAGANGAFTVTNNGTGLFSLSQEGAGAISLLTSATERVRILSGGNVGIGTAAPDSLLHVNGGNFKVSGTITSGAIIGSGAIGGTDITASGFLRSLTLGIGNSNTAFTVSNLGAIVGTALNAGAGLVQTTGAVNANTLGIGTSNTAFTVSNLGAIVGTALNAGDGLITTSNTITGGAIIGTSLNVAPGAITGGAITGTSLDVAAGAIACGAISATGTVTGATPTADTHLATKKYVDDNVARYKEYRLWTNGSAPAGVCSYQVAHDVPNFTGYSILLKRVGAANAPLTTLGYPGVGTYIGITNKYSLYLAESYITSDRFVIGRNTSGATTYMIQDIRLYTSAGSFPGSSSTSTSFDILYTNTDWQMVVRIYY